MQETQEEEVNKTMDIHNAGKLAHVLIRELRRSPDVARQRLFGATGDTLIVVFESETHRFKALRFTGEGEDRETERHFDMTDEELRELVLELELLDYQKLTEMTEVLSGELDRFLEEIQS